MLKRIIDFFADRKQIQQEQIEICMEHIERAVFDDNAKDLSEAVIAFLSKFSMSQLKSQEVTVEWNNSQAGEHLECQMPWHEAIVVIGSGQCMQWAFKNNFIRPNMTLKKSVELFGKALTVKDIAWIRRGSEEEMKYWSDDVRKNDKEWKKLKNLSFLKPKTGLELMQAQWMDKHLDEKNKLWLKYEIRNKSVFEKIEIGEIFKDIKRLDLKSNMLGWSSAVCKEFVRLGWCSEKEMIELQKCIETLDVRKSDGSWNWHRPDVVAEMEGSLLKKDVINFLESKSNKKNVSAL